MRNCDCNEMSREQCALLRDVSILSFFVVDMALYVDTHPDDKHAQEYLTHYAKILNETRREYAQKYCALLQSDADCYGTAWDWDCMPLPWEGGCD